MTGLFAVKEESAKGSDLKCEYESAQAAPLLQCCFAGVKFPLRLYKRFLVFGFFLAKTFILNYQVEVQPWIVFQLIILTLPFTPSELL